MIYKDFAGGIIKLHHGDNPAGMLGFVLRDANPQTNAGKMSARVVISTARPDRSDDVVETKGIDLSEHKGNPIVLLNHNKDFPIGHAEDRMGAYTVKRIGDDRMEAETFFTQATQLGEQAFQLVERKVLRGASIGFLPVLGMVEKRVRGVHYKAARLVEYSHLAIPDNADCLILAVEKGIGGKALCDPLLQMLRPLVPERAPVVTSGWEEKGGTYKMQEAKEVEPQTRSSIYYTCPHCGNEMTHESIFKEEDGTTRHGPCRGAVVLKAPKEPDASPAVGATPADKVVHVINPELPKSFTPTPRFLPGLMKVKAMQPYDDPNATAVDPGDDEEFIPGDEEEEGPAMKGGAEAHHGVNDILMQAMQFIQDSQNTVDNATAKKTLDKVSKWIGKALAALHAGHSSYLEEHPDQPPLPGQAPGMDGEGDEDEDGIDDDEDIDADGDGEPDDMEDDTDDADDKGADDKDKSKDKPKKKKPPFGKSFDASLRKALNDYWEFLKMKAIIGDGPIIEKAIADLKADVAYEKRTAVRETVKSLSGLLVHKADQVTTPPITVATPDDWDKYFAELNGEVAAN
jgi:hypothetical protein